MNNHYDTTIAAISTAMSNAGIGIVRMSGCDAFDIADRVYKGKKNKKLLPAAIPYDSLWIYYR